MKFISKLFNAIWAPFAPFEITEARPCLDNKEAEGWGAHAIFHIPDTRPNKKVRNPDADGNPQRVYGFKVNKPNRLFTPDEEIKKYVFDHFKRLNLPVLGITVKRDNGDWKYIPFYLEF